MDAPSASPGVRFPPPFYAALGVLFGWLLQRLWPLPAPEGFARLIPGYALVAVALLIFFSAMVTLRRHQTTIRPDRSATALVDSGPFALSRNPIYIALILMMSGLGFLFRAPWVFLFLPVMAVILDRFVIAREERHLAAVFGPVYEAYRMRVRRWV
ncbi:MAG TPA: isoprenylcysteine carboxylmethyltransferase family protein [Holophagaceae bacterium]|jgi:protein-S-isoprenylcysteine O-methyltransferase Ste14|nr:isoprenylcysteine carboxylmethyltransferase family protein [Holophagaceae bacterium]